MSQKIDNLDQIYYWDEFLTPEHYESIWIEFDQWRWELQGHAVTEESEANDIPRMFWYKNLEGAGWMRQLFKIKTEMFLNNKIITHRLYGNGQAHGQSGWIHKDITDSSKGRYGSLVYFLHRDWKPIYGGNIFFTDESKQNVTNTFFPKTNSAVMFNSRMNHCALEPSVYCTSQRISIAFKFKFKEISDPEEFLLKPHETPT